MLWYDKQKRRRKTFGNSGEALKTPTQKQAAAAADDDDDDDDSEDDDDDVYDHDGGDDDFVNDPDWQSGLTPGGPPQRTSTLRAKVSTARDDYDWNRPLLRLKPAFILLSTLIFIIDKFAVYRVKMWC